MSYHYEEFFDGRALTSLGHGRDKADPRACVCGRWYHVHPKPFKPVHEENVRRNRRKRGAY
jgi:hypothetical protein